MTSDLVVKLDADVSQFNVSMEKATQAVVRFKAALKSIPWYWRWLLAITALSESEQAAEQTPRTVPAELTPIYVYQVDDETYVAAADAESATAEYLLQIGPELELLEEFGEPAAISEERLAALRFDTDEGANGRGVISFREQLDFLIASGEKFPCLFAMEL